MAIAVTPSAGQVWEELDGTYVSHATLLVTGLTAAAANTIPHGLVRAPVRVVVVGYSASGLGATAPSLDGSAIAAGFDATNVYVITPAGVTTCKLEVEY